MPMVLDTAREYTRKVADTVKPLVEGAGYVVKQELGMTEEVNQAYMDIHTFVNDEFEEAYVNGEMDVEDGLERLDELRDAYVSAVREHTSRVKHVPYGEDRFLRTQQQRAARKAERTLEAMEEARSPDEGTDRSLFGRSGGRDRFETRSAFEQRRRTEELRETYRNLEYTVDTLEESVGSFAGVESAVEDVQRYAEALRETYRNLERRLDLFEETSTYTDRNPHTDLDMERSRDRVQDLKDDLVEHVQRGEQELRTYTGRSEDVEDALEALETYRRSLEERT